MRRNWALSIVFVSMVAYVTPTPPSAMAAQGNWSQGCAPGWVCQWKTGPIGTGVATSTTQSDSTYVGNSHWDGTQLGDRVKYTSNKSAKTATPYKDPSYMRPYPSVVPNGIGGAYFNTSPDGVSSIFIG